MNEEKSGKCEVRRSEKKREEVRRSEKKREEVRRNEKKREEEGRRERHTFECSAFLRYNAPLNCYISSCQR
jgi:hypothetical protein